MARVALRKARLDIGREIALASPSAVDSTNI